MSEKLSKQALRTGKALDVNEWWLEVLVARITALEAEVKHLRQYANHQGDCELRWTGGRQCTCGFLAVLTKEQSQ